MTASRACLLPELGIEHSFDVEGAVPAVAEELDLCRVPGGAPAARRRGRRRAGRFSRLLDGGLIAPEAARLESWGAAWG